MEAEGRGSRKLKTETDARLALNHNVVDIDFSYRGMSGIDTRMKVTTLVMLFCNCSVTPSLLTRNSPAADWD